MDVMPQLSVLYCKVINHMEQVREVITWYWYVKSSQYHFIANTNSVHKRHINKKVMEFVKGKPKGTNPAIMGNPIDICAVNGSKRQSILLLEKPHLNYENHAQCKQQNTCSLSKECIVCDLINILVKSCLIRVAAIFSSQNCRHNIYLTFVQLITQ